MSDDYEKVSMDFLLAYVLFKWNLFEPSVWFQHLHCWERVLRKFSLKKTEEDIDYYSNKHI